MMTLAGCKGNLAQLDAGQFKKQEDTRIGLTVIKHDGKI